MSFLESLESRPAEDVPYGCLDEASAMAEYKYWTDLISGVAGGLSRPTLNGGAGPRLLWDLAYFDTSVECITGLFHMLADGAREVPCSAVCKLLKSECRITASTSAIEQACDKVYSELHGVANNSPGRADFITFLALWHRIMLAAVYSEAEQMGTFNPHAQNHVNLVRFGTGLYAEEQVTECQWMFGGYFAKTAFDANQRGVLWLRIDDALPSEVIRIGIKMYFHPLMIEDLLSARTTCITQATCYREHHCISLELYYLFLESDQEDASDSDSSSCGCGYRDPLHGGGPLPTEGCGGAVGSRIRRGVMTFVAPSAQGANQHAVLTFLDSGEKSPGRSGSMRSQFSASQSGVKSYLDLVQQRIRAHVQLREQPAFMILWVILNTADRQLGYVCDAYAERLFVLKYESSRGASAWRSSKDSSLMELSSICLELKELLQWVDRLQDVAEHLVEHYEEQDGGSHKGHGAHHHVGHGEHHHVGHGADHGMRIQQNKTAPLAGWSSALVGSLIQAISRSKASLLQQSELAKELKADLMQARQDLGENSLFIFSMIGSSYFPAQFLTGVFGMNFDHMPVIHEMHGYLYFWLLSGLLVILVPLMIVGGLQVSPDKRFLMSFSVALAAVLWITTGLFAYF